MKVKELNEICFNSNDDNNDNFVGLKFIKNEIKVYFPIGYRIPKSNEECRKAILSMLKTIDISSNILNEGNIDSFCRDDNNALPINSYIWIINDYLKNGLFKNNTKVYVKNPSGKINWKKTLNSNFNVSGKNIVYLNPYVEKNTRDDNIITNINAYCLAIALKYIGWLFGNLTIPENNINASYVEYYISIINYELIRTFDSQKKNFLMHLKKILQETCSENEYIINNYGVYKYETIWEYMINEVFGNKSAANFFPSANWNLFDWKKFESSKLRPDTIMVNKNNVYVLDSKYYKFGITFNPIHLPNTSSIQKQITYAENIDNNYNYNNVFNAFIIPYNKLNNKNNLKNNIQYVGYAESDWKKNVDITYEGISLILVDTKYLIDCYTKNKKGNQDKLIIEIMKINKSGL